MFKKIRQYLQYTNEMKKRKIYEYNKNNYIDSDIIVNTSIENNLLQMKELIGKSSDVIFKEFKVGINYNIKAFVCMISGLTDKNRVEEFISKVAAFDGYMSEGGMEQRDVIKIIKENLLFPVETKEVESINDIVGYVLSGNSALFIDGYTSAFVMGTHSFNQRNVQEPLTETTIRGSREGFVENIVVNMSLIRKIIKNSKLMFELNSVGQKTHTKICLVYIDDIVNKDVLSEVKKRLNNIDIDYILESGYIEQYLDDNPSSIFTTIGNSEKPDKVAAKILEGRVAIICDGSPFVLTIPYVFAEAFQVTEDYYSRPYIASVTRMLRILAFMVTTVTPALYVALTTFHHEMIPSMLLISFAAAREGVPFPAAIECAGMLIVFELMKESGVRMPRPIGQTVTIVGTLVLGEAAVDAGIIGPPMIIIISLTGISGFIVNPLLDVVLLLRFFFLIWSGMFGMFGLIIAIFIIAAHLCSLDVYGTPYLIPLVPINLSEMKDSFIRMPLWFQRFLPRSIKDSSYKAEKEGRTK
ncbi:spore germination protein [Clostridium oryzae]|uniref:Spore germination protein B1 n=1 Tax=Clostridium oryzae TaxID=1450648 RepID=A0A1V4II27_9CLOT|nr:spore germination protein [Clostridium oryzae]OPJ59658.1 spore germination protein B1 [Clostridium oryzae]